MIRVVGLGQPGVDADRAAPIPNDAQIVARSAEVARTVAGNDIRIDLSFDDLFDSSPATEIAPNIANQLKERARNGDVTYLVPGHGQLGDLTVATLAAGTHIAFTPGTWTVPGATGGSIQVMDALEMAVAESLSPFDTGLVSIDPTTPTIVTNFYGEQVVGPAAARLSRIFGDFVLEPDASRALYFPARDAIMESSGSIDALAQVMACLRSPDGCPWDREQTVESLLPMLREEVDELAESIESGDTSHQMEESGDVLMHLVMVSQIMHERGAFSLLDVVEAIRAKMVRRHPHVFAGKQIDSMEELYETWEDVKRQEKEAAGRAVRDSGGNSETG